LTANISEILPNLIAIIVVTDGGVVVVASFGPKTKAFSKGKVLIASNSCAKGYNDIYVEGITVYLMTTDVPFISE
jgi:hypothetical protein